MQIAGKTGNDASTPALSFLTLINQCSDSPIETNQFSIDRKYSAGLGMANAVFDIAQQAGIALWMCCHAGEIITHITPFWTRLQPSPTDYPASSSFSRWLTSAGLALPRLAFITWPTKKPNSRSLPPR